MEHRADGGVEARHRVAQQGHRQAGAVARRLLEEAHGLRPVDDHAPAVAKAKAKQNRSQTKEAKPA